MTIQEAHYEFKLRADKVDGLDIRELRPNQIDWLLNIGYTKFLDTVADSFEAVQEVTDILGPLSIVSPDIQPGLTPSSIDEGYRVDLSDLKYTYYRITRIEADIIKNNCSARAEVFTYTQNNFNNVKRSPFYKPSFIWREVPAFFGGDSNYFLYLYTSDNTDDENFQIDKVYLSYIKQPKLVWVGTYDYYDTLNNTGTLIYNSATDSPVGFEVGTQATKQIIEIAVQELFKMYQRGDLTQLNQLN